MIAAHVPDYPWHCTKCGKKLKLVWVRPTGKFSARDGHEYIRWRHECPDYRGLTMFINNGHSWDENDDTEKYQD